MTPRAIHFGLRRPGILGGSGVLTALTVGLGALLTLVILVRGRTGGDSRSVVMMASGSGLVLVG